MFYNSSLYCPRKKYEISKLARAIWITFLYVFLSVLRLGRCIDIFYTALNTINIEDPFLKYTLTISKLAHALYLYADHIVWLTRSGFLKTDSDSWNKTANKFWLLSIIANLSRDFYEIVHLLELHSKKFLKPSDLVNVSRNVDFSSTSKHIYTILNCHKDVVIDTMKNSCDLFIPLTALGFIKLSPSAVGVLGAISSLAAIVTVVKPITKLVPAWTLLSRDMRIFWYWGVEIMLLSYFHA